MTWPEGKDGTMLLEGHARDAVTRFSGGPPIIVAEDRMHAVADRRVIVSVASEPPRKALASLVGVRAGGHLRSALDAALREERIAGTPLYLLLDDLAGTTLIGGWAWSRWQDDWMDRRSEDEIAQHVVRMEGVCIGFRPGSSALGDRGRARPDQNATAVPPLPHPEDPEGWHKLIDRGGVNMRRARRIDVWREDRLIHVDCTFQDSASAPVGGRIAIHEYKLEALADPETRTLISVKADARTLPYKECPAAMTNISALAGTPMADLRLTVLTMLGKTAGCTHLNDALRSLAEVPRLVDFLPGPSID